MKAEIISTGTELLLGKTLNTSVFYLTGQLSGLGIEVDYHTTVGDNRERLLETVLLALNRSQLIFLTGGLGPTVDDLTKEVVALVLGLEMKFDFPSMNSIENFYQNKKEFPLHTEKQAFFPEGAIILPNDFGTAPGAMIKKDNKYCFILPGPPSEMKPMFDKYVLPELQSLMKNGEKLYVKVLKVFGFGESDLELELADLMSSASPFLTLLDKHTYMDLRITVRSSDREQALNILRQTEDTIRHKLGNKIFGADDETHSQVTGRLLRQRKLTVATAESCSGGLLGGRMTDVAGSSDYYLGGVISYSNYAKEKLLGVNSSSLLNEGAVSEKVAGEMAEGVRRISGADLGLSTTGVAGPGGGTNEKPVGQVYIALAHAGGVSVKKLQLAGNRDSIRNMTVESALDLLRIHLIERN